MVKTAKKKGADLKVVGGHGEIGHNSKNGGPEALSDDALKALTLQHKGKYVSALATKKKADADFKNVCKLAKSELGATAIDDIKDIIASEEDGFEEKLKAELQRKARVSRWLGLSLGVQADLFDSANKSMVEKAFEEGKTDGMQNKECKPSYTDREVADSYVEGWHKGNAVYNSHVKEQKEGERLLRPAANVTPGPDEFDGAGDTDDETFLNDEVQAEEPETAPEGETGEDPSPEDDGESDVVPADDGDPWPDDAAVQSREDPEVL